MKPTRPPGRPPLDDDDESVSVSTRMPSRQFNDLYERAQGARVSVAEQLRRDAAAAAKKFRTEK
jgi:hypothetical protein